MSSTFKNTLLSIFILISASLTTNANAGLIVGEFYTDNSGAKWEYVSLFDLVGNNNAKNENSPHWSVAKPVNGLEAAAYFLDGSVSDFAVAAFALSFDVDSISAGDNVVNHLAWYDGNLNAVSRLSENIVTDANSDGKYDSKADVSAWVDDRAFSGDYINYVFKKVASVPETSTIAIFVLALCGLGVRRLKN